MAATGEKGIQKIAKNEKKSGGLSGNRSEMSDFGIGMKGEGLIWGEGGGFKVDPDLGEIFGGRRWELVL